MMNRCGERRWPNCLLKVIFLIVLLMETVAFADSGWFKCAVNLSGPGRNETFIQLTDLAEDPVFITKWFRFSLAPGRCWQSPCRRSIAIEMLWLSLIRTARLTLWFQKFTYVVSDPPFVP